MKGGMDSPIMKPPTLKKGLPHSLLSSRNSFREAQSAQMLTQKRALLRPVTHSPNSRCFESKFLKLLEIVVGEVEQDYAKRNSAKRCPHVASAEQEQIDSVENVPDAAPNHDDTDDNAQVVCKVSYRVLLERMPHDNNVITF